MATALITPPAVEPLTLAEVKAHLRVDHDHEDSLIASTLTAARQYAEHASGQCLITQVWRQYESKFPEHYAVSLYRSPVISIDAVTAFDNDGTPHVLAMDTATLQRGQDPAILRFDHVFNPASAANGLEIDIVVGFGDLGVDVPDSIKRAILLLVAHWYEFRGAVSPQDQPVSLPPGFEKLVSAFRRSRL